MSPLLSWPNGQMAFALRSGDEEYIDWFQTKEELYDLRADPAENRNLAEDRSVTARYRALRDSLVGSIYRPPEMGRLQAALTGAARR